MQLAWLTDLHIDHAKPDATERLLAAVEASGADAVLLGGDLAEGTTVCAWLERLADRWQRPIYLVLGNHDFYKADIPGVRRRVEALAAASPHLFWLPASGVVELTPTVGLVGHGGWGDARLGDFDRSTVLLNDYIQIADLAGLPHTVLKVKLQALGAGAAATLAPRLFEALRRFETVVVLTHVPPWRGACWHLGKVSDDNWLPHFSCGAIGELLMAAAGQFPDRTLRVYCGHTHSDGVFQPAPNLTVWTGKAEYGSPEVNGLLDL